MAYNTAAKAYGNNRIETATPAELTLMLYEGAVKFCNIAIVGLEKNDYEKVNTNIQKCRNIIRYCPVSGEVKRQERLLLLCR